MGDQAVDSAQKKQKSETDVGSVFISNYPPYSTWTHAEADAVEGALSAAPAPDTPMGLYVHIPFCRKRCKFCYFKVYTDQNSKQIQAYLDAVEKEIDRLANYPAVAQRKLKFVYFGGGTPSFISGRHLESLITMIRERMSWDHVEEVTFECEPGTLTKPKLEKIRELGITRLSLGVENFSDRILEENGRAHLSPEIYRVLPWIKALDFDQFNIDLISGMVGETEENWHDCVHKAIDMEPDSVTIYQLELPYNTVYSKGLLDGDQNVPAFADWATKRAWHNYAIETMQANGYDISSAYTMVKRDRNVQFRYRDSLWQGADLLPVGVSSFGHLNGVHYQNNPSIKGYTDALESDRLPIQRAHITTERERLIREMILQLKLGEIPPGYFKDKFGVNILDMFDEAFQKHRDNGFLTYDANKVTLTREGLLRVDSLLPAFYEEQYRGARYT